MMDVVVLRASRRRMLLPLCGECVETRLSVPSSPLAKTAPVVSSNHFRGPGVNWPTAAVNAHCRYNFRRTNPTGENTMKSE
jgi:hypothetical protein